MTVPESGDRVWGLGFRGLGFMGLGLGLAGFVYRFPGGAWHACNRVQGGMCSLRKWQISCRGPRDFRGPCRDYQGVYIYTYYQDIYIYIYIYTGYIYMYILPGYIYIYV